MRRALADLRESWKTGHLLVLLPLAFIVLISIADISSPSDIHLGPLLVVAPAITASFAGSRLTALIGAAAVAAQVVIGTLHGGLGTANHETQIAALLVVSAVIVFYCRVRERRGRELAQVRTVSEAVQQVLLRPLPNRLGPLRVATTYLAAEDEALVGGDLYAAARTGSGTRLLIGDVRGKGLPAIGDAALVLGAFRELAHHHAGLVDLAVGLEASFCRNLAELADTDEELREHFVTTLLLDVPDLEPVIRITNCGHPPPLLLRGGQVRTLHATRPAPPLGMCGIPNIVYYTDTFAFEPGDTLLLHTDGITEARNAERAFYPLADRVVLWPGAGPEALLHHLRRDLRAWVGGPLRDDAVLIALRRVSA
ncbi:PP2C family protein-serine/threonine phosphatase [Kitasatospora sp. MAP5-34]|uniref:PP2C family protein-serine/threonine phosphatase n=1 Tax=Kitasatospora sp. MAP5-34 TaxID=3035102 RepID=UPI002476E273|nr:PP2C family protein-serine/threonine phosphatase [Kitasatospora sp. MAP5-34]